MSCLKLSLDPSTPQDETPDPYSGLEGPSQHSLCLPFNSIPLNSIQQAAPGAIHVLGQAGDMKSKDLRSQERQMSKHATDAVR